MSAYQSKYSWKNGYTPKVSAEIVGNALDGLKKKSDDGMVNAQMLLEYSRPETSDTHDLFEWNDGIAAEKWRMYQSGRIINQLEVTIIRVPDEDKKVIMAPIESLPTKHIKTQAYVNIAPRGTSRRGAYTDVVTAFNNDDFRRQVLLNAKSELDAFARKYERYEELAEVIASIKEFGEAIT